MNGVRRLLGGGGSLRTPSPPAPEDQLPPLPPIKTTAPLAISAKPSWPPSPLVQSPPPPRESTPSTSPPGAVAPLFSRKDAGPARPPLSDDDPRRLSNTSIPSPVRKPIPTRSPANSSYASIRQLSSPSTKPLPSLRSAPLPNGVAQLSKQAVNSIDTGRTQLSRLVDTHDELLMTLLASQAIVDSREVEILSAEEVDALKKEYQVLASRQGAMLKKLNLESKIRDAALSLSKINAAHKGVSKQTSEQLETANRKVEIAQKELWRVSERANDVHRKLLEHRSGVLSLSLQSLEAKVSTDPDESVFNSSFRSSTTSRVSSVTSASASSHVKFEGAHFFAGHADAVPVVMRTRVSAAEVAALESRFKEAAEKLDAAMILQADTQRELTKLRLEKNELETSLKTELRTAEDSISTMEAELETMQTLDVQVQELLKERDDWERDRAELEDKRTEVELLERRLEVLEEKSGEAAGMEAILTQVKEESRVELERKEAEVREMKAQWENERERERAATEEQAAQAALRSLQLLMQSKGVVHGSEDLSMDALIASLETHVVSLSSSLDAHKRAKEEGDNHRQKLQEDLKIGMDERERLVRELEDAQRERENARREARSLGRVQEHADRSSNLSPQKSPVSPAGDSKLEIQKVIAVLLPVWASLPSPEARAAKFGARKTSPVVSPSSPQLPASSLSDVDVRNLKLLYDGRPTYPDLGHSTTFSVEAFAARVQAVIADDRALIERLMRFAQAHDLLKKNAERAQKLAQDSSLALETYQKQVKVLEDRNIFLASDQAALQDEVQRLQTAVDRTMFEKREVEMQAAEQAETCRQLTDANNTLSAKALALAEEAATAPEAVRRQLEGQLNECRAALQRAEEEVDDMRSSEQSQRVALLDELNSMQTENGNLRAQLRAVGKR